MKTICSQIWLKPLLLAVLAGALLAPVPAMAAGGDILLQAVDTLPGKQEARSAVVDHSGNIVIGGYHNGGGPNDDYHIVKMKGDGTVMWRSTWDRSGSSDQITAVTTDSDDHVAVAGYIWNGVNHDIHVMKYRGDTGAILWHAEWNGAADGTDVATCIATDPAGNIYVAGYSQNGNGNDDFVLLKFSGSDGTLLWTRTYDGGGVDRIRAISVGSGRVAVTGESHNGSNFDFYTILFDVEGNKIWEQRHGDSYDDGGQAVKIDRNGDVVVTGFAMNASNSDLHTIKYGGASGNLVWERQHDGGYEDEVRSLFVDNTGEVFISGYTWSLTGRYEFYSARYAAATGAPVWEQTWGSGGDNDDIIVPFGIAADEDGDVFVTGYVFRASTGNHDIQVLKYKRENGNLLWEGSYDGPSMHDEKPVGMGFSPLGELYVAGWTESWTSGATDYNFLLLKFDPGAIDVPTSLTATPVSATSVQLAWQDNSPNEDGFTIERKIGLLGTYTEVATVPANTTTWTDTGLTADTYYFYRIRSFNAASGHSRYSNETHALTTFIEYRPPQWAFTYGFTPGGDDHASAIAAGTDGDPVVTGYSFSSDGGFDYLTMKLDRTTGAARWNARYDDPDSELDVAKCVTVNGNDIFVSGYASLYNGVDSNVNSVYTLKYAGAPPEAWGKQYNGPGRTDDRAVAVASAKDGSGGVVVTGYGKNTSGNEDIYVIRYNADGTKKWSIVPYDGGGDDFPTAVAVAPSGDVFVTGYRHNGINFDLFVARYRGTDGALVWSDWYNGAGNGDDYGRSIAIGSGGEIYVAGSAVEAGGTADAILLRYDGSASSAVRQWVRTFDGDLHGADGAVSVRVDPIDGAIVVAATVTTGPGDRDFHVRRYKSDGSVVWEKTVRRDDNDDTATAMEIDSAGNIIVAGTTSSGIYTDILTLKLGYMGEVLAAVSYDGAAHRFEEASAVAVNDVGEAFVAGYTTTAAGDTDYLVLKLAPAPIQPPDPLVAVPSYSGAALSWTDKSTAEDGYRLERRLGACGEGNGWTSIGTVAANATSFSDSGLSPGATYCYRIAAFRNNGEATRWITTETVTPVPTAPGSLTANPTTPTTVNLGWTDRTTAESGFRIFRCTGAGCTSFAEVGTAAANATSYSDSVCEGTQYRYQVTAFATGKWETAPAVVSVTSPAAGAPSIQSVQRVNETRLNVNWTDTNSDESGFKILRCSGTGCTNFSEIGTAVANAVTYADTTVAAGGTYGYQVKAYRSTGCAWEKTSAAAYGTATILEPATFNATATGTTSVLFTWQDRTSSETGFSIERCSGSSCSDFAAVVTPAANAVSGSDTTVCEGTTYRYRMRARNTTLGWDSPYTATVNTTTTVIVPPVLQVAATESQAVLQWGDAASDETGYRVERCSGAGCSNFTLVQTLGANSTTWTDTVSPNSSYTYRVSVYRTASCSWEKQSNEVTVSTAPVAPGNPGAAAVGTGRVNLSWTDRTTAETGFEIYRCAGSGCSDYTLLTTTAANAGSYSDTTVCSGTSYSYRIRAVNGSWQTAFADAGPVTTAAPATPSAPSVTSSYEMLMNLSWTDTNSDEAGFRIERCQGASCSDFSPIALLPPNTTSWTDTLVAPATQFSYRVVAYNSAGCGWERPSAASTGSTTLNSPGTLAATSPSTTAANLTWNDTTTTETSFRIERCSGASCADFAELSPVAAAGATSYVDSTVCSGQPYRYRVRAHHDPLTPSGSGGGCWTRRAPVTIGNFQPDFQTRVTVAYVAGMKSDFSDLRFVELGLSRELPYWIESKVDGVSATIWFRTGTTNTVWLYYGNASATAASTTSGVFEFFDDFTSLDTSRWTATGSASVTSGELRIQTGSVYLKAQDLAATANRVVEMRNSWTTTTGTASGLSVSGNQQILTGNSGSAACATLLSDASTSTNVYRQAASGATASFNLATAVSIGTIGTNTWRINGIEFGAAAIRFVSRNADYTEAAASSVTGTWSRQSYLLLGSALGTSAGVTDIDDLSVDWVRVRKLAATEPSAAVGTEEGSGCLVLGGSWDSGYSNTAAITITAQPAAVTLNASQVSEVAISLTWNRTATDETGYRVERCTGSGCSDFAFIGSTLAAGTTSYSDTGLTPGRTYTYRVRVFKTAGCSWESISTPASASTTIPGPQQLTVAATTTTTVRLTWQDTTGSETGFQIERCEGSSCSDFGPVGTAAANATTWTDTGVCENRIYRYRVAAVETTTPWTSAYTAIVNATTASKGAAPSSLAVQRLSETELKLTWTDTTADEEGFRIERCTGSGCTTFSQATTVTAGTVTWTDRKLTPDTLYRYRVIAYRNSSCTWETAPSAVAEGTTTNIAPAPVAATLQNTTTVRVTWADSAGTETGYAILRCMGSGCSDFAELTELAPNTTSYNDAVCSGTSYTYAVKAVSRPLSKSGGGCWTVKKPLTFTGFIANKETRIVVPYAAEMQNDFDDLRFWDSTASVELPYWIQTKTNGTTATIWVKTGANATIEMYYGNPAAGTGSSGTSSFSVTGTTVTQGAALTSGCFALTGAWDGPTAQAAAVTTAGAPAVATLTVTRRSETAIDLSWGDPASDETGFKVERCSGTGCTSFVEVASPVANATSMTDSALASDTVYRYRVRAYKTAGCGWYGGYSPEKEATTSIAAPGSLTATPASNSVQLGWTDTTSSETGSSIERCEGASCTSFAEIATVAANATSYTDSTVCSGITYRYRVRSLKAAAWYSPYSSEIQITTPAPPAVATFTVVRRSETALDLSWGDPSTDETGFKVERCSGAACTSFVEVASPAANATSMTDSGLAGDTLFRYRVRAYKTSGCGWSGGYSAIKEATTTITAPGSPSVTPTTTTSIQLGWSDTTSSESGFSIERCEGASCTTFAEVGTVAANATSYTDTSVCSGITYRYRVRSLKTSTWYSPYSAEVQTTTPTPSVPSGFAVSLNGTTAMNLSWTDTTTDESGFYVERCSGASCSTFSQIASLAAGSTTFSDSGLPGSATFCYRVRAGKTALCSGGWYSGWSAIKCASTPLGAPSVTAVAEGAFKIKLTWPDTATDEDGYEVEVLLWNGQWSQVAKVPADTTSYVDTIAIEPQKTYTYRMRTTRGAERSAYTTPVTITTPAYQSGDSTCR